MSRTKYETGLGAEEVVVRHYSGLGATLLDHRMRNMGGEIDLIFELGQVVVFVEVKARKSHAAASRALGPEQAARINVAAAIWLDETGRGGLTPSRIDLALVDGMGRVDVIENAVIG